MSTNEQSSEGSRQPNTTAKVIYKEKKKHENKQVYPHLCQSLLNQSLTTFFIIIIFHEEDLLDLFEFLRLDS